MGDTSVCVFLLVYPCGIVVPFLPFCGFITSERLCVFYRYILTHVIVGLASPYSCYYYRISRQCTYIPKEISELYTRLKLSKGVTRGKKKYWVTSAIQRGLCNGENGIVFSSSVGTAES